MERHSGYSDTFLPSQHCHCEWEGLNLISIVTKLVESLLSVDILSVSCGNEHVVVVGGNGDVYTWGRGAGGRLGLGNEEDHCTPQKVQGGPTELNSGSISFTVFCF